LFPRYTAYYYIDADRPNVLQNPATLARPITLDIIPDHILFREGIVVYNDGYTGYAVVVPKGERDLKFILNPHDHRTYQPVLHVDDYDI
jgi:hypothetical protein